jgi:hypothetical protein
VSVCEGIVGETDGMIESIEGKIWKIIYLIKNRLRLHLIQGCLLFGLGSF